MGKLTYAVEAGVSDRPETIDRGSIEKNTGQTVLAGEAVKTLAKRADIGIPNWTEAWGVRLDKDGKVPEQPLDIKDVNYKGQIKPLKWGDPKGCLIVCRYLKGYNSIDMLYQKLILNADSSIVEDNPSSADVFYLRLQSGDNFYDPEADKYLTLMLQVHYLNGSSKYRNPELSAQQMFTEINAEETDQKGTGVYISKFDAMKIVNEASTDNTLNKLKNLYEIVGIIGDQEPSDKDLFRYLSMLADTKSDLFLGKVNEYKKEVSNIFEKAKSYSAIDLTKNGTIAAGKDKIDIIGTDIPGKGDSMIDWVIQNFLDQKAWEVVFKLKQITDKLN